MPISKSLNQLSETEAEAALYKCCASRGWVAGMLQKLPFQSDAELTLHATEIWWSLSPEEWLQAFSAHPMIGDFESLGTKFADTKELAGREQAGVIGASEIALQRLAAGNQAYFKKFGYIFIVCATGRSADEMLAILTERIENNPAIELPIAAAEQLKITFLRLREIAK